MPPKTSIHLAPLAGAATTGTTGRKSPSADFFADRSPQQDDLVRAGASPPPASSGGSLAPLLLHKSPRGSSVDATLSPQEQAGGPAATGHAPATLAPVGRPSISSADRNSLMFDPPLASSRLLESTASALGGGVSPRPSAPTTLPPPVAHHHGHGGVVADLGGDSGATSAVVAHAPAQLPAVKLSH